MPLADYFTAQRVAKSLAVANTRVSHVLQSHLLLIFTPAHKIVRPTTANCNLEISVAKDGADAGLQTRPHSRRGHNCRRALFGFPTCSETGASPDRHALRHADGRAAGSEYNRRGTAEEEKGRGLLQRLRAAAAA